MPKSDEYITPKKYVDAARDMMGEINFDPCSKKIANEKIVKADTYYTKEEDCLQKEWPEDAKYVWMNPPYSREVGTAGPFVEKMFDEWESDGVVDEGFILLNVVTSNNWFQPLWAFPMCFLDERVCFFLEEDGELVEQTSPRYDNVIVFLPDVVNKDPEQRVKEFKYKFEKFGAVTNIYDWL